LPPTLTAGVRMERLPRRTDRVLAQRTAETIVLLDLDGGEYFTLNDVGGRVWELCDGSHTVSEIVEILAAEYEAPPHEIQGDVEELLTELADEKLVQYPE
jgi:pyrroloquinoline quinone biosynthesis protein D